MPPNPASARKKTRGARESRRSAMGPCFCNGGRASWAMLRSAVSWRKARRGSITRPRTRRAPSRPTREPKVSSSPSCTAENSGSTSSSPDRAIRARPIARTMGSPQLSAANDDEGTIGISSPCASPIPQRAWGPTPAGASSSSAIASETASSQSSIAKSNARERAPRGTEPPSAGFRFLAKIAGPLGVDRRLCPVSELCVRKPTTMRSAMRRCPSRSPFTVRRSRTCSRHKRIG